MEAKAQEYIFYLVLTEMLHGWTRIRISHRLDGLPPAKSQHMERLISRFAFFRGVGDENAHRRLQGRLRIARSRP
jgi:hypothetical protein